MLDKKISKPTIIGVTEEKENKGMIRETLIRKYLSEEEYRQYRNELDYLLNFDTVEEDYIIKNDQGNKSILEILTESNNISALSMLKVGLINTEMSRPVKEGRVNIVISFLMSDIINLDERDLDGRDAMYWARKGENTEIVKELLTRKYLGAQNYRNFHNDLKEDAKTYTLKKVASR